MSTLTYCKALPTTNEEWDNNFEQFLFSYSAVFREASIETLAAIESTAFNKSKWNTYLQVTYGISKRHANGVIASVNGRLKSAKECRKNHIKQLESKLKSAKKYIKSAAKKIKSQKKFYSKQNWINSKVSCLLPASCSISTRKTALQSVKFGLHHKKRYAEHLEKKIPALKAAKVHTKLPYADACIVGSKDEKAGNQVCQWNGERIKIRVPKCLEAKFGKHVEAFLGNFNRNNSRLPNDGAKTWHFYRKDERWVAAIQFTPIQVKRVSRHSNEGCIGIDLNPSSIGWTKVDRDGNLEASGKIPLLQGLPKGKQDAQIADTCLQLAALAKAYECPIVYEKLDFSAKKSQLREEGRKYARMLSGWAYSRFFELLGSICSNRGIYVFSVNAAYTSVIGLVKYMRMYGLSSDTAAAMAIARRGMRLSERLPSSMTALLEVNSGKHVWSLWNQLNKLFRENKVRRHSFYFVSNCIDLVKPSTLRSGIGNHA